MLPTTTHFIIDTATENSASDHPAAVHPASYYLLGITVAYFDSKSHNCSTYNQNLRMCEFIFINRNFDFLFVFLKNTRSFYRGSSPNTVSHITKFTLKDTSYTEISLIPRSSMLGEDPLYLEVSKT